MLVVLSSAGFIHRGSIRKIPLKEITSNRERRFMALSPALDNNSKRNFRILIRCECDKPRVRLFGCVELCGSGLSGNRDNNILCRNGTPVRHRLSHTFTDDLQCMRIG